ncbi:MarR family transcriptional regulator [Actinomadura sp. NPDC000929]|uniref:MarR family winged helix-turn-helix transcriptional regulator n=1 Tax=Actinomadura sp. NPDC000929 TaxID=3154517 RepID=UPI00339B31C6
MDETAGPLPPRLLGITAFVLAQVGRAGRSRMGRMLDEHGLGLWHFAVLSALDDAAPASQRDLAVRLRIDPSDLVEVVGRLEEAGLVRRERDPADRRRYVVEPTAEGRLMRCSGCSDSTRLTCGRVTSGTMWNPPSG